MVSAINNADNEEKNAKSTYKKLVISWLEGYNVIEVGSEETARSMEQFYQYAGVAAKGSNATWVTNVQLVLCVGKVYALILNEDAHQYNKTLIYFEEIVQGL